MMTASTDTERLSTSEAADLIGVSARTLERLRERGLGPPYVRLTPRVVFYSRRDLDQWVAGRRVEPERCSSGLEARA